MYMGSCRKSCMVLVTLVLFSVALFACDPAVRKRPYGDIKLGMVKDLLAEETYLEQFGMLLRRDAQGFYVMSTYCTKDLSHLKPAKRGDKDVLACPIDESTFSSEGKVISGPAVANLPYYELEFASSMYGGPVDALYVKVGYEVSRDWRLALPLAETAPH